MFSIKRLFLIKKCLTDTLDNLDAAINDTAISQEDRERSKADYKDIQETLADVNILIDRHNTNCNE